MDLDLDHLDRLLAAVFIVVTFGGYGYGVLHAVREHDAKYGRPGSPRPSTSETPHADVEGQALRPCTCGRPTTGDRCSECDAREVLA